MTTVTLEEPSVFLSSSLARQGVEDVSSPESIAASAGLLRVGVREIHRLGFGAMRILGPQVWGDPADPGEAKRVLRRAVELGVNFIDTAYSYGPEVNERLIAEALHPYPTDLLIATKTGFQRGGRDDWRADCRPRTLRADCERSLRLLRLERLHLLQLHTVDPNVPIEESMGALAELQREGKVDHVGVSNVDIDQLARARAVTTVVSVQNRYSILARGGEDVLGVCERDHLAFIPWFPLGAGAVGTTLSLDQVASRHKATRFQIAIAWLLRRSPVVLPIPGTASVVHLEENMAAARIELSDDDLSLLAAIAS